MLLAIFFIGFLFGYFCLSIISIGKIQDMKIAIKYMALKGDNSLCRRLVDER
jgi:hypothetical protein